MYIFISLKPIKAKFYRNHLYKEGISMFINNPGHMAKMAAMPIFGKNPSRFFCYRTMELGM